MMKTDGLLNALIFARVAEARSFTRAAEELGLSKATVSRHVSAMEAHLGTPLLRRTTRSLSLTEAGARFYQHSARILQELRLAEDEVRRLVGRPGGVLRIVCAFTFGLHWVAPLLGAFLQRHPNLRVALSLSPCDAMVVSPDTDIALKIDREPSPDSRHLADCPHLVCAAPSYVERHGRPRHSRELTLHRCVSYGRADTADTWHLEGPEGSTSTSVVGGLHVNTADAVRQVLLSGYGLGLLPYFLVARDLAEGRLVDCLPGHLDRSLAVYAATPQGTQASPNIAVFLHFLGECLARGDSSLTPTAPSATAAAPASPQGAPGHERFLPSVLEAGWPNVPD